MAPAAAGTAAVGTDASPSGSPRELHDWFGSRQWTEWTTVTGDWNSTRSRLETRGLTLTSSATIDASSLRPGTRRTMLARGLVSTTVALDLAEAVHMPGSSAAVQLQWRRGPNASAALGDLQVFSNIDVDQVPLLGEAWYEQQFGPRARIKAGRIDANREFAALEATGDFLSSAMAFSPSIDGFPTYPDPSPGVFVAAQPVSHVAVHAAAFDGSPGDREWMHWTGRFWIVQAGGRWSRRDGGLPGTASAGHFAEWRGTGDTRAAGSYLSSEQVMWQHGDRQAAAFLQAGWSDAGAAVRRHVGAGMALRGMVSRRSDDVTGIGATWASPDAHTSQAELVLEAFHRIALTPSITLIPDAQFLTQPAGDAARRSTVVWTLRCRFDL